MTFAPVATDLILLALFVAVLAYARAVRRDRLQRARWQAVLVSPAGGAAALVLCCYLGIATVDSLRFEVSGQRLTLLDLALTPLRTGIENTYSAPLAIHAHARETRRGATGRLSQVYPRLRHAGQRLREPAREAGMDRMRRAAAGLAGGGLAGLATLALAGFALCGRPFEALTARRWRAHRLTLLAICLVAGLITGLATHYHVFGTDKVGNDVLFQCLKSVRTGLVFGLVSTALALPFAIGLGIAAGYFRGLVDDAIQFLYTTLSSIPGVLLIAAAALSLDVALQRHTEGIESMTVRGDLKLLALCAVLGLSGWTSLCRVLRAETLKLAALDFVDAAHAMGVSRPRILLRHLLPNVMHLVIITTVLDFSGLVMAEAVLTYIDIGVDPGMESWGNMINGARLELAREPVVWWSLGAALAAMFVLVLAANLFADAMQSAFDPRHVEPVSRG